MIDEKTNKYFGYCIDLFDKLSVICNFTYDISLIQKTENISKSSKTTDENWNKIVNELVKKVCIEKKFFSKNFNNIIKL